MKFRRKKNDNPYGKHYVAVGEKKTIEIENWNVYETKDKKEIEVLMSDPVLEQIEREDEPVELN